MNYCIHVTKSNDITIDGVIFITPFDKQAIFFDDGSYNKITISNCLMIHDFIPTKWYHLFGWIAFCKLIHKWKTC
jgi:hypothetical protein